MKVDLKKKLSRTHQIFAIRCRNECCKNQEEKSRHDHLLLLYWDSSKNRLHLSKYAHKMALSRLLRKSTEGGKQVVATCSWLVSNKTSQHFGQTTLKKSTSSCMQLTSTRRPIISSSTISLSKKLIEKVTWRDFQIERWFNVITGANQLQIAKGHISFGMMMRPGPNLNSCCCW